MPFLQVSQSQRWRGEEDRPATTIYRPSHLKILVLPRLFFKYLLTGVSNKFR